MTKKQLEEKVQEQSVRIAELEQELAGMKARNAVPVAAVQRQMTMDSMKVVCNSPWPNFTVLARTTR